MTGYSQTPLAKKLGLKDGQRILFVDLPPHHMGLTNARDFVQVTSIALKDFDEKEERLDFIHCFTKSRGDLENSIGRFLAAIARNGMIWISWPKKAAKIVTDMSEDVIREVILPMGLVDVKVCAVDEVWSGLKLVIRKELR